MKFFCAALLFLVLGCSTATKPVQERVSKGMDKDQVLDILGNPSRSKRVSGADKWSYDQHINGKKTTVHVYFENATVTYVGSDEDFEKSLKESVLQKNDSKASDFKDLE